VARPIPVSKTTGVFIVNSLEGNLCVSCRLTVKYGRTYYFCQAISLTQQKPTPLRLRASSGFRAAKASVAIPPMLWPRTIACRNPTAYKLVSRHRIG
jgi:hypothetical protein